MKFESPKLKLMFRPITINAALNGYTVQCGCQQLVFNDPKNLLKELAAYLADPTKTELRYRKDARNAKHTLANETAPAPAPYTLTATYNTAPGGLTVGTSGTAGLAIR